jgi:transcriptional regulator with PAS, ATPase and Fis domain
MVIKAYEKYGSSYKVAEELGISQTAAYRKIKKYLGR